MMCVLKVTRYFLYAGGYLFKTKILRREIPFIGGLVINEKCNLRCRQCSVSNRVGIPDLTYEEVGRGLDDFYARVIRSVFIEGGEPFLWKEGNCTLDDVIQLARNKGFLLVSIYTNGTFPIEASVRIQFL
jgi:MoaA/NifB/PqqE/SkfB family radical SAM enzyme